MSFLFESAGGWGIISILSSGRVTQFSFIRPWGASQSLWVNIPWGLFSTWNSHIIVLEKCVIISTTICNIVALVDTYTIPWNSISLRTAHWLSPRAETTLKPKNKLMQRSQATFITWLANRISNWLFTKPPASLCTQWKLWRFTNECQNGSNRWCCAQNLQMSLYFAVSSS